ncbi:ATP-dependent Clp protease adaptor protein ClpS [Bradyrhizobium sp. Rc2d]|uniref:ATP-dependent Clp protease adaptor ClpS n=1 Tax=Bradyrhizobium sp. Rc2d TaxID=1855321 RepID=UPI0008863FD9|nr:ATP-dependent Clp protease adaptor ClpS [Bradyrhizobium sp. Rc2d]SDJ68571.1 ATP-dependent Clp protease adaptor protein ClpS [Bradyrhizobium sp. Rc2d]
MDHQVYTVPESVQLVFQDGGKTPRGFVVDLFREVFGRHQRDAYALSMLIERQDKAACGPFPPSVAKALFDAAQERIRAEGHTLQITSEPAGETEAPDPSEIHFELARDAVAWHFADIPPNSLVTMVRRFPGHMRADIQIAIDKLFASPVRFFGLHQRWVLEKLSFAELRRAGDDAVLLASPQYHEIDIGEATPVKCLHNGLWLSEANEFRYAVVLYYYREPVQQCGTDPEEMMHIEVAVPAGGAGESFAQHCFVELERAVQSAGSYRGKILSLESDPNYSGRSRGVTVHRWPRVDRADVILPEKVLKLLDGNVLSFVGMRDALRRLGQSTRKGILLYGPPGTGKTHTIRYLATNLADQTTLIMTAAEVGALGEYMNLARLLQPVLVVIEDVDLIARDRNEMRDAREELLLNRLLNEMDGLKEDADILFLLTTNRLEELEGAIAARPGRIDQVIEVPLPDANGRDKLVRLYGKRLPLTEAVVAEAVRQSEGVSAAFIKEFMRRIAQSSIARDGGKTVICNDIDQALDAMLPMRGHGSQTGQAGP